MKDDTNLLFQPEQLSLISEMAVTSINLCRIIVNFFLFYISWFRNEKECAIKIDRFWFKVY